MPLLITQLPNTSSDKAHYPTQVTNLNTSHEPIHTLPASNQPAKLPTNYF